MRHLIRICTVCKELFWSTGLNGLKFWVLLPFLLWMLQPFKIIAFISSRGNMVHGQKGLAQREKNMVFASEVVRAHSQRCGICWSRVSALTSNMNMNALFMFLLTADDCLQIGINVCVEMTIIGFYLIPRHSFHTVQTREKSEVCFRKVDWSPHSFLIT